MVDEVVTEAAPVAEAVHAAVPVEEPLPPTIFERFWESGIIWCRFCGTTDGVNWRKGPWGSKTLCNRHGVAYKGQSGPGSSRLELSAFEDEAIEERTRPVVQEFCCVCGDKNPVDGNEIVMCEGCPWAYHQRCYPGTPGGIPDALLSDPSPWFCTPACISNMNALQIPALNFDNRCIPALLTRSRSSTRTAPDGTILPAGTRRLTQRPKSFTSSSPGRSPSTPRIPRPIAIKAIAKPPSTPTRKAAGSSVTPSASAPTPKRTPSTSASVARVGPGRAQSFWRRYDASDAPFIDIKPTTRPGSAPFGTELARSAAPANVIVPAFRPASTPPVLPRNGFELPWDRFLSGSAGAAGDDDADTEEDTSDEAYAERHRALPIFRVGVERVVTPAERRASTGGRRGSEGVKVAEASEAGPVEQQGLVDDVVLI